MPLQDKKNHITIAKAIGIILMVTGHAGVPCSYVNDFIYIFHMPLFFFCSGYFFREITQWSSLQQFTKKRITGLYIPYLKWSFAFLLLHNLFFHLHICESPYELTDFYHQGTKILAMIDYEAILRPFWFLKALLLASVGTALLSFINFRFGRFLNIATLIIISLSLTLFIKATNTSIPVIGDISVITLGIAYILSGYIYRQYENQITMNKYILVIIFAITTIGSTSFIGTIDMRYTTLLNTIPYYFLSILGIILVIGISAYINNCLIDSIKKILYYIGNHTMPILALHLLAFKLGNLAKIWLYNMPIDRLSDHTKIPEHNEYFWILYVLLGISIPLLLNYLYHKRFFFK